MSGTRSVERAADGLAVGVERTAAAILGVLVLGVAWETVSWIVFAAPPPWAEEVQGVLLIWFGFLAAAAGVRRGSHLGVDWLDARLPAAGRRWTRRCAGGLVALFGGLVAFYGASLVSTVSNRLPATGWSAAVGYVPAVVGGGLIVLFALAAAVIEGGPGGTPEGNPPQPGAADG